MMRSMSVAEVLEAPERPSRLLATLALVVPAMAALVIGLTHLTLRPLWTDELITISRVENGFGRLISDTWDLPLLPYYATVYIWTLGGQFTSDAWLRGLSLAMTVAAVTTCAAAIRRLYGPWTALVGGSLLAIAPSVAYYAQEGRAYAVGLFLVCLSTFALVRMVLVQPQRSIWLYSLSVGASAVLMQSALMVLVIHPVVLLALPGPVKARLIRWGRAVALALPLVVLAAVLLTLHGSSVHGWLAGPDPGDLLKVPALITRWGPYGLILISVALLTRQGLAWLAGGAAAVAAIWLLSVMGTSFWLEGTLTLLMPILAMACAASLSGLRSSTMLVWLCFIAVVTLPQTYGVVSRIEPTRYSRAVVDTVVDSDARQVLVTEPGLTFGVAAAFRHYAPDVEVQIVEPAQSMPNRPYWIIGSNQSCAAGLPTQLTPTLTMTLCP